MSFRKERLLVKFYLVALTLTGSFLLYRFMPDWGNPGLLLSLLFFTLFVLAAEQLRVPMSRRGSYVSISFAPILAAVLVLGPVAAWAAGFGQLTLEDLRHFRQYYHRTLFNITQIAVSTVAAAQVYLFFGGVPGEIRFPEVLWPLFAACVVYFSLNVSFVVLVLSFSQRISALKLWILNFRWALPNYFALASLGVLVALLYTEVGFLGVVLLLIPLLLARHTFIQYMEMRNTYMSTIKAFVKAIEAKDKYTSGHSERVAHYAVAVGKELRLTEGQLEKLEYLAILHDIGKISIGEGVLNKPDKLSEDEFDLIRTHPQVGAGIIEGIKFIGSDADVIRYHHKWVNGRGYPYSLNGRSLPLGAKIIAAADAFDAMTSDRAYRKAMPVADAVLELKKGSGTQFDTSVAEALVEVLKQKGDYSER